MASSDTEICNMAIGHLGSGKAIASMDEKSAEAKACSLFYDTCLKMLLRDFAWPAATQFVTLALVGNPPTETDEWRFSYRYPSDCLSFRRILSGSRDDSRASRIPYRIGRDAQGKLIYCDIESAKAEYTVEVDDVTQFPDDMAMSLSLLLASFIAPTLTAGDPFKMGQRALQLYQSALPHAQNNAFNEEQADHEHESSFIEERN